MLAMATSASRAATRFLKVIMGKSGTPEPRNVNRLARPAVVYAAPNAWARIRYMNKPTDMQTRKIQVKPYSRMRPRSPLMKHFAPACSACNGLESTIPGLDAIVFLVPKRTLCREFVLHSTRAIPKKEAYSEPTHGGRGSLFPSLALSMTEAAFAQLSSTPVLDRPSLHTLSPRPCWRLHNQAGSKMMSLAVGFALTIMYSHRTSNSSHS